MFQLSLLSVHAVLALGAKAIILRMLTMAGCSQEVILPAIGMQE